MVLSPDTFTLLTMLTNSSCLWLMAHSKPQFFGEANFPDTKGNVIWAWMRALKCLEPLVKCLTRSEFLKRPPPAPRGVEAYVSQPLPLS